MSMAAAASGEQLLAWVRAALARAEARTGLPGFVAVKGRQKQMVKYLGHSVAQLLSMEQRLVGKAYNSSPVINAARTGALGDYFVVDNVAFSVVNQTDHGGVTWACWSKDLELPTHAHPAMYLHLLGGRTGAAANAGSAASAEAAPPRRPALTPALLQLAILPQLRKPRRQPPVPRPKPGRISFPKSAWVSRRPEAASALFAAPPPTRCQWSRTQTCRRQPSHP